MQDFLLDLTLNEKESKVAGEIRNKLAEHQRD